MKWSSCTKSVWNMIWREVSCSICVRFTGFSFLLVLNQDSFGSGIYPKTSCELNCTSKGFSCNFLDLAVRQSPQDLSCYIFYERSQPEYAGIEMIRMPHVHSNISMTAKLRVINSQFCRFLRLCSCKKFSVFQMVSLIVFLKAKGCPLKVLTRKLEGCFLKKNSCLEFLLLAFSEWFCFGSCNGELFVSPLVHSFSLFVLSFGFSFPFLFLCFFVLSLLLWSVASQ